MLEDFEQRKERNYKLMKSVLDYGMGLLITCFGIFFLFAKKMGFNFGIDALLQNFFGGMCIVYGLFRVYRGYKKNYFRD